MLILTRKVNESIVIGEDIKITIMEISEGTVRIGFQAPRNVEIFREEVYKAIQEENKLAAANVGDLDELGKIFKVDSGPVGE